MRSVLSSNKKGQLGNIGGIMLSILFVVVVIGVVYLVGDKFLQSFADNTSHAYNQTSAAFESADTAVDFLPILVLVVIAGLILFVVARFGGQKGTSA